MKKSRVAPRKGQGAIFLDRDGVINASPSAQKRYITSTDQFRFLPGVLPALRALHAKNKKVVVLSNQAGVGRGWMSASDLQAIHRDMRQRIRKAGGHLHAVYTCPHAPSAGCSCRKPKLGLFHRARRRFSIDPKQSFLIGDNVTDIQLGKRAGCTTLLVLTGRTTRKTARSMQPAPDRIEPSLQSAVRWVLKQS